MVHQSLVYILEELKIVCDSIDPSLFYSWPKFYLTSNEKYTITNGNNPSMQIQTFFDIMKTKPNEVLNELQYLAAVIYHWQEVNKFLDEKLKGVNFDALPNSWKLSPEQKRIRKPFTHGVPRSVELFVGREQELKELYELMNPNSNSGSSGQKIESSVKVVIHGLGGIGKTQLALRYIEDNGLDFDAIVWINSESQQTTEVSFISLAKTLNVTEINENIKTIVTAVYRKLSETASKILIVFDNADEFIPKEFTPNEFIQSIILIDCFSILITSRNLEWKEMKKLKLEIFKDTEAIDFIKKSLNNENYDSDTEVFSLALALNNFPLALKQAVAYIRESHDEANTLNGRFTINEYLTEYNDCKRRLLGYQYVVDEYNNLNVATTLHTWTVTLDKLKKLVYNKDNITFSNSDTQTLQIKLLRVIAYMASQNIDPNLFLKVAVGGKRHLSWAVFKLGKYSMVDVVKVPSEERVFLNVHKLVQQITRLHLEDDCQEEQTFRIVFSVLHEAFPRDKHQLEDVAKQRELLPHLLALKVEIENYDLNLQLIQFTIFNVYVPVLRIQQDYLWSILNDLHQGYHSIGNSAEKKKCLLQLLSSQYRFLELPNCEIAKTLTNLGTAVGELGHPKTTKILLERALKIQENHYGSDHFEVIKTWINLAVAYGYLGDPKSKKILLERALNIQENQYGPDYFGVAITLVNLTNAYGDLGDHKTTKNLLERALKIQEKHYGPNHFEVSKTLVLLAVEYSSLDDPKMKKLLLEKALKIQENHYGSDHFEVAKTLVNLSDAYGNLGDLKTEKILLERALKIQESHISPEHFEIAVTISNLAFVYGDLGDMKTKKILLERALKIQEKHYGPDHFKVTKTMVRLAVTYGSLGDLKMKKILLERALKIQENHYGPNHFEVAITLVNLGMAYDELGDRKTRKILLERALKIQENLCGTDNFEMARTLVNLSNAYRNLGNPNLFL